MKVFFIGVLWALGLFAQPTVYVTYGPRAGSELIIRYLTQEKTGYIKLKKGTGYEVKTMESITFGEGKYLQQLVIQGLDAGEIIQFKVGTEETQYQVRTLPKGDLRFCVAGDLYQELKPFRKGIEAMGKEKADFVILGGDLAYVVYGYSKASMKKQEFDRYVTFLTELQKALLKENNELVPLIAALGNHDYKKGVCEMAEVLFFPPLAKSYCHYELNDKMDLAILDTHHKASVAGLQTRFLESVLKKSQKAFKIAAYHVAGYPSVYPYKGKGAESIRTHFCPLFETYGVKCVFEHHNHAFKVTHPMKEGHLHQDGVTYFGDGCLGVKPRAIRNAKAFYLKEAKSIAHYYIGALRGNVLTIQAKDVDGACIAEMVEIKGL